MKKFILPLLCVSFVLVLCAGAYSAYQWYKLDNEYNNIKTQKNDIETENSQLQEELELIHQAQQETDTVEEETAMREIFLYYYNIEEDKKIAEYIPCSEDAVLPVEREIPLTISPVRDTLDLLLKGILTESEIDAGFQTEFPNKDFLISSINLSNGVLYIDFTDAPSFVNGGSCRTGLLEAQIRKTALQFPEVKSVEYVDQMIFQP